MTTQVHAQMGLLFTFALWSGPIGFATALVAQDKPAPKATESELDKATFLARPDLWQGNCALKAPFRGGGVVLPAGAKCFLENVNNGELVLIEPGQERTIMVAPEATDAFELAAAAFAKLTKEQRTLDYPTLAKRADLWPKRVRLVQAQTIVAPDGRRARIAADAEFDFGCFDGEFVRLGDLETDPHTLFLPHHTDLIDQARAQLLEKPRAVGRVLEELDDKLIDLGSGKPAKLNLKRPPKYTLLYFSARWSRPCRQFSPKLVDFYKSNKQAGRGFEVVFVSRDHGSQEMAAYAKEERFPWLAVRYDQLRLIPIVQAYARVGIPDLMVLDADGNVLSDSYQGADSRGPDVVLAEFKTILAGRRR